jgi:predicted flap endonuclease-1-like 5' DNA nuclease
MTDRSDDRVTSGQKHLAPTGDSPTYHTTKPAAWDDDAEGGWSTAGDDRFQMTTTFTHTEFDASTIPASGAGSHRELFRCRYCGLVHPQHPLTVTNSGLGEFHMGCPGCGEDAPHAPLLGVYATLQRMTAECDRCGYATLLWELTDDGRLPRCPECMAPAPASRLQAVSGVGSRKAEALVAAGFERIEDLQAATQAELAAVDGIGNALAARIKADVAGMREPDAHAIADHELVDAAEEPPRLSARRATWVFRPRVDRDA